MHCNLKAVSRSTAIMHYAYKFNTFAALFGFGYSDCLSDTDILDIYQYILLYFQYAYA